MKFHRLISAGGFFALMSFMAVSAGAASIGPSGYTNDFSTRPPATDFSTSGGITGAAGDVSTAAALDAAVQNLAASSIAAQVTDSSPTNPPVKLAAAQWTAGGSAYLMTRPTGIAAGLLMARLVNNTGTNCNVLHLNYQLTVGASVTEEVPGQRLYYSFSAGSGAWTLLPAVSGVNASGVVSTNAALNQVWNNGSTLYLLWADDNALDSTEGAYEIDNFFASAYYLNVPLSITLTAPANGQHFGFGSTIPASVALTGSPTNVSYFIDGTPRVIRTTAPFTPVNLPPQSLGSHTIYAAAQDTNGTMLTTVTNTFFVDSSLSGTLATNTTLYSSNSPYVVSGNVTVPNGVTLAIQAGTTVQLDSGVNIIVANGGRLLADGTSNAPIHFTRSGASGNWGNITIDGAVGSPESRITHARFDFNANSTGTPCIEVNAGAAFLDYLSFGNTGAPYIHVDGASFVISHCYFPTATAAFELCHGTRGVRTDGHGIFRRNFFGKANDYNDVVDFTGSQRGNPIVHFINNVTTGGDDDGWDIDGTDAWVEGNIFCHQHKNGSTPDSSSAVSGGNFAYSAGDPGGVGTETSEITVIGNIIYDCDEASDAKQGNFYTYFNNTIVHQSHIGGIDSTGAVVILADTGTAQGAGIYLEGNIIYDAEQLTRNVTTAIVTFTNNIMPFSYSGPGGGNSIVNPMFKHVPLLSETYFTNWAQAQVMRDWLSLLPGSPGIGTGPNGRDKGAVIPIGVSISGEPDGTTTNTSATLHVGINRTGHGIPTIGWPSGSGYIAYKWRLDGGLWSAEMPINTPISISNLSHGSHYVEVTGKRDSGLYQDDPLFGEDAVLTRSRTWMVAPRIDAISLVSSNSVQIQFTATTNTGYTIQYRADLSTGSWQPLVHVDSGGTAGPVSRTDTLPPGTPMRFYRLAIP